MEKIELNKEILEYFKYTQIYSDISTLDDEESLLEEVDKMLDGMNKLNEILSLFKKDGTGNKETDIKYYYEYLELLKNEEYEKLNKYILI